MKRFSTSWIVATAAFALLPMTAVPALAQGKTPQAPTGPAPKTADGKPDFSGLWERPYTPDMSGYGRNQTPDPSLPDAPKDPKAPANANRNAKPMKELPFTAAGKADWESYDATNGDYTGMCMPFGLVRSINSPDPMQIMQNPVYFGLLFEQNTWFHLVRMNGEHPKNVDPTWFGDSVAKWDGDTLVIDTVGFNEKTRLDTIGHPHSTQLHTIERYSRPDAGHINYEITIDDPGFYTKSWKNTRVFTLRPDWQIIEYSCEENNKDFFEGHIKGIPMPGRKAAPASK